jgi:hypothetical protein
MTALRLGSGILCLAVPLAQLDVAAHDVIKKPDTVILVEDLVTSMFERSHAGPTNLDAGKPNGIQVSPDQKTLYVLAHDNGGHDFLKKGETSEKG